MIKGLIQLTVLAILVTCLAYLLNNVGPLGADTKIMLKYLGFGVLGLAALGIVSVTILGLTAIILGISFAKGAGFWSGRRERACGTVGETVGAALKGALGGMNGAGSACSRKVELSAEKYGWTTFRIKTLSGDLTVAGHDQPGAKATVELLEKSEGDAEACFEDGEIKIKTKSGGKALIGDATVFLPSSLAALSVESVNGDIVVSGFVTEGASAFKGVNGDISVSSLKNGSEVAVKTVSGDVEVKESQFNSLLTQSISGDVLITDSAAESAVIKTVSGDIDYSGSDIKNPSVKTVSGSVKK
ncbi:MAG: DUF4097 family beta strand repeat protein [Elusimicrobia bacterium]|nr:DUF4097 family beta strand repeat protein [Elusimicrobiota bacterium]